MLANFSLCRQRSVELFGLVSLSFAVVTVCASSASARTLIDGNRTAPIQLLVDDNSLLERLTLTSPGDESLAIAGVESGRALFGSRFADDDGSDRRVVVHSEGGGIGSYMQTLAMSGAFGALTGFLIGGAVYILRSENSREGNDLWYWTAGGVLGGLAVGTVQIIVQESRATTAVSDLSVPSAPVTERFVLVRTQF